MGLNEGYEPTRRHILVLKPIPSIEDVFNMITQDERQKNIKPSPRVDNVAFQASGPAPGTLYNEGYNPGYYTGPDENAAYATTYNNQRPQQKPMCTHCGRLGHTIQKCYKLNGYPPGHKFAQKQPQGSSEGMFQPRGQMQQGPRPPFNPQYSQATSFPKPNIVVNAVSTSQAPPTMTTKSVDLSHFSQVQVQSLIAQLNAHVHLSEQPSSSFAMITANGHMAPTSTSGPYSGLDDW
ncbi:uncharacterized protein LOC112082872 [Eutrema salsugineum]|uniref:uncharacterized protein LOC112082872 n=1 Tax=Eutrema salsugineum TaxID=72664 RepID=UPI000CECEA65|nr:uncharacterized protein LOC112082872 [Eutrema salsugineum]